MAKESLKNLFESKQDNLRDCLRNLELPKDAPKIERIVSEYLNNLFDENGEFRMQLTQSEDYILQSAMSLLNAQQAILVELSKAKELSMQPKIKDKKNSDENWADDITLLEVMKKLKEKERNIINKRFFEGRTQMEVAEEIGISQAQVSRLEKNAIEHIKKLYN